MACFGSKALQSRRSGTHDLIVNSQMTEEEHTAKQDKKKKSKNRRAVKETNDADVSCGSVPNKVLAKGHKSSRHQDASVPQTSVLRKHVDPETTKYFTEIANLFESAGIDLEERLVICGNALEETRGKELEVATDYIISHTLQTLLEGCDVEHLCGFLKRSANDFPYIATDRSGSHVAETALKSLALHLQDSEAFAIIEETLTKICQVVIENPAKMMRSRYGSHVLRSLLCVCKGVPVDAFEEFHTTKSSTTLAKRLNTKAVQPGGDAPLLQPGFPEILKFLVTEMLENARHDLATLRLDKFGSLVLQTALKLLVGEDHELIRIIPTLLWCRDGNVAEQNLIEVTATQEMVDLLADNAYSHLMEVILEVAPEPLYDEVLRKVFKNLLFEISSHHCGSFVVQALISSARCQSQMDLIWEELGGKFKELLEIGRAGVVASILAASQRLHLYEKKCCEALAAAVHSMTESSSCLIPRILFLENYLHCGDKSNWRWAKGDKMHTLGCLMLQTIFKYRNEYIQTYVTSMTSMETEHVLEIAKDVGGGRVIESFLCSGTSAKQKCKLIVKLRGHFGELAMHPSGSFLVEKCFASGNMSLKETIASELLAARPELSKTKQGPHLLRKLDIDGFGARPDQWKSRQITKQDAYKDFYAEFGPSKRKSSKDGIFLNESSRSSPPKSVKKMRKEIDQFFGSTVGPSPGSNLPSVEASLAKLGFSGRKRTRERAEQGGNRLTGNEIKSKSRKK